LKLKIKDVVFKLTPDKKQYAEILFNGKTGTRHIPLIDSIPHIKDWISQHPQGGNPNSILLSGYGKSLNKVIHVMSLHKIYSNTVQEIKGRDVKVELIYNPEDHNIIFVEADKPRLTQVISNLVNNAVKFTKKDGGTVSIGIEEENKQDNGAQKLVVVTVKDTGTGIDPEILPRLFTKFVSKSFQGTGLGLFISKSIVEEHGGKIWAKNNSDGRGAIFMFSLPVTKNNS
jgi:signal transduction histidine kinase